MSEAVEAEPSAVQHGVGAGGFHLLTVKGALSTTMKRPAWQPGDSTWTKPRAVTMDEVRSWTVALELGNPTRTKEEKTMKRAGHWSRQILRADHGSEQWQVIAAYKYVHYGFKFRATDGKQNSGVWNEMGTRHVDGKGKTESTGKVRS